MDDGKACQGTALCMVVWLCVWLCVSVCVCKRERRRKRRYLCLHITIYEVLHIERVRVIIFMNSPVFASR